MKKAFTLAEVLVTLGIIGVVATLLLPSIFKNTNNDSEVIDNTKSKFTRGTTVVGEFSDELSTNINEMDLDSCRELVIRKYNNRVQIHCRR